MAKKATITDVSTGYQSNTTMNDNFEALNDAFDNTLSLDGSTPNAMGADLDMDSNDILNADTINTSRLKIGGQEVAASDVVNSALVIAQEYDTVANMLASTTVYTAGQYLHVVEGDYYYKVVASSGHVANAGGVQLDVQPGANGYNVDAFGAKGDGVTNDSAAFQAALDTYSNVFGSNKTYLIGDVNIKQVSVIPGEGDGSRRVDFSGSTLVLAPGSTHLLKNMDSDFTHITGINMDMNNVPNAIGIHHAGGWHVHISDVQSLAPNVADTSYDMQIDGGGTPAIFGGTALWGAYTSEYHNMFLRRVNIEGDAVGGYVTTLRFYNVAVQSVVGTGTSGFRIVNAGALDFYSPILQNCDDAFYMENSGDIRIYNSYVESATNYIRAVGEVKNIRSVGGTNGVLGGGLYINGTITGNSLFDDAPTGFIRTQQTGDITRGVSGSVSRETVQDKTVGVQSSEFFAAEPGGFTNTTALFAQDVKIESTTPLKAQRITSMNRGDQMVTAMKFLFHAGSGQPFLGIGANSSDPTASLDLDGFNIRLRQSNTPASATASGEVGEIRWDNSYLYMCVATNTWKRVELSTW